MCIQTLYVDKKAMPYSTTDRVLKALSGIPVYEIEDPKLLIRKINLEPSDPGAEKQRLLLTVQKGRFFEPCPGTPDYICCGYYVLNTAVGCPYDCTYCYLNTYQNVPFITMYVNVDKLIDEVCCTVRESSKRVYRLGNGEYSESLALEPITGFTQEVLPSLLKEQNIVFELKTKSTQIDSLDKLEQKNRVVVAWSLNPDGIVSSEERKAPSLMERVKAAKRCVDMGFRVAFHFDPIIHYEGWEEGYKEVIDMLEVNIPSDRIAWISLGCLRFSRPMIPILEKRYPGSKLIYGEIFPGDDGKLRYFRHLRVRLLKYVLCHVRKVFPSVFTYLCMESKDVWNLVYDGVFHGYAPGFRFFKKTH